jgi:monovalent cation:H+ antiporter-2, CPA2 family
VSWPAGAGICVNPKAFAKEPSDMTSVEGQDTSLFMHAIAFLQDLAVVMIAAALVTLLFQRLHQPLVLGYILAGVIIGPHTPPFPLISDQETINTLAELGIIFLMFSLGLEFSLRKLRAVGGTAFIAATLEILLMFLAGSTA